MELNDLRAFSEEAEMLSPCILASPDTLPPGIRIQQQADGYVTFWNQAYGSVYAHRWAYAEAHGEIPKGMCVCHKCDVPACVNSDHLFVGTHRDNHVDAGLKGRRTFRSWAYPKAVIDERISAIVREACATRTCGHREHREKLYQRVEALSAARS